MSPIIPIALAAGQALSGILNARTAAKAKKQQLALTRETTGRVDALQPKIGERLKPYTTLGSNSANALGSLYGFNDAPDGFTGFKEDPGYQYALSEGENAINKAASASGLRLSGGTHKALTRHAVGAADQQYGSYINRLLATTTTGLNATNSQNTSEINLEGIRGNALSGASNAIGHNAQIQTQNLNETAEGLAYIGGGYVNGLYDSPKKKKSTGYGDKRGTI